MIKHDIFYIDNIFIVVRYKNVAAWQKNIVTLPKKKFAWQKHIFSFSKAPFPKPRLSKATLKSKAF